MGKCKKTILNQNITLHVTYKWLGLNSSVTFFFFLPWNHIEFIQFVFYGKIPRAGFSFPFINCFFKLDSLNYAVIPTLNFRVLTQICCLLFLCPHTVTARGHYSLSSLTRNGDVTSACSSTNIPVEERKPDGSGTFLKFLPRGATEHIWHLSDQSESHGHT